MRSKLVPFKEDRTFFPQVYLSINKLIFLMFPTVLIVILHKFHLNSLASFIVSIYMYLTLAKTLLPVGMDILLQRTIFFESEKSIKDLKNETIKLWNALVQFWQQRIIILFLLISATKLSCAQLRIELNFSLIALLGGIYSLSGISAILMAFLRNSVRNISCQIIDGLFSSVIPTSLALFMISKGDLSLNAFCTILFICQLMLIATFTYFLANLLPIRSAIKTYNQIATQKHRFQIQSFLVTAFTGLNSRYALLIATWILNPEQVVMFDLLLKLSFLAALSSWSGNILNNEKFVKYESNHLGSHVRRQVTLSLTYYLLGYLTFMALIWLGFLDSLMNINNFWTIVLMCFVAHLLDVPTGVLGYALIAKAKFKAILIGQSTYFLLLSLCVIFINSDIAFFSFVVLSHSLRVFLFSIVFMHVIGIDSFAESQWKGKQFLEQFRLRLSKAKGFRNE